MPPVPLCIAASIGEQEQRARIPRVGLPGILGTDCGHSLFHSEASFKTRVPMHRYYFDLRDDRGLFVDDEGLQCSDLKAVQTEAARTLADMARDAVHIAGSSPPHMMSIEVRDDGGPVMQIRFTIEINMQN